MRRFVVLVLLTFAVASFTPEPILRLGDGSSEAQAASHAASITTVKTCRSPCIGCFPGKVAPHYSDQRLARTA